MFDGLFSPTRHNAGMAFVPTEGGTFLHTDSFHSPDVAYSNLEQCEDDNYLVVPSAQNRRSNSRFTRVLRLCGGAWSALVRRIGALS
jgi:hypothetical protein